MGNKVPKLPSSGVENRRIVVIGGGFGGVTVSKLLEESGFEVTLIDKKRFFFNNIGSSRMPTIDCVDESTFSLETIFKEPGCKFVVGTVVSIDPVSKTVLLLDNQTFNYDFIVLATGCPRQFIYPMNIPDEVTTVDEIKIRMKEVRDVTEASEKITVLGGAPFDIELAAELAYAYPSKTINLVHSGPHLLDHESPNLPPRIGAVAKRKLEAKKVNVYLNEKVITGKEDLTMGRVEKISTESGLEIPTDLAFFNPGGRAYAPNIRLPAEWIDERYQLRVNRFQQIIGDKDGCSFAIGDSTDVTETKFADFARFQAKVTAQNIYRIVMSSGKKSLKKYRPISTDGILIIMMGADDGIFAAKGHSLGWLGTQLVRRMKGRDYFFGNNKKGMGVAA